MTIKYWLPWLLLISLTSPKADLFQQAEQAIVEKNLNLAFTLYKNILDQDPTSVPAIRGMGLVLWMDNRPKEAIICYERVVEINPNFVVAYADLSVILSDQKQHQQAVAYAKRAVQLSPNTLTWRLNYADILWQAERYSQAAEQYRLVIAEDKDHLPANIGLGSSLISLGQLDRALTIINRALTIDPDHLHARYNQAVIYTKQGQIDLALSNLQFVLSRDADHAKAQFELGFAYQQGKQFHQAVEAYHRALTLMPKDPSIYYNLAHCHARLGKTKLAKETHAKAKQLQEFQNDLAETQAYLQQYPNEVKGYLHLGELYLQHNQFDLAERNYKLAIQANANYLPAYQSLADFYIQQKALEKATHVYLKAVQHFPQEVQTRVMLSLLYKEQNDFQAAKTHLKIAETQAQELVEERGKAEDLEKLSFVYYAQGRYAEAESLLLNLLSAAPQNTDYLNQLETVRAANN